MATLNVGLVGCGERGGAHLAGYAQVPEARVVACCDNLRERAEARARQFGIESICTDYHDLLARDDIDAIDVVVPHHLHAPIGIASAQAGKHVLMEKPITTTLEEAKDLIDACNEAGVKLQMFYPVRYTPQAQLMKQIISEGIIGDVITVMIRDLEPKNIVAQSQRGTAGVGDTSWKIDRELSGGGALHRDGIHRTDYMRWLAGSEVKRVYAEIDNFVWNTDVETTANVLFRFQNGAIGELDIVWCALMQRTGGTVVLGTKGAMQTQGQGDVQLYCTDSQVEPAGLAELIEPFALGETYAPVRIGSGILVRPTATGLMRNPKLVSLFADCVLNDKDPTPSGVDGARALEMVIGAYRSVEEGKAIELPLVDF